MSNLSRITLRVRVAWWLRWYLAGVLMVAYLTRREPDNDKLRYWVCKAVRCELVPTEPTDEDRNGA